MHDISLYERILHSNLINFIIMVYLLVLIIKKARLGDLIQKLADDVKNDVELSAKNVQDALKEYKEAKRSTKDVEQIKENINLEAKESAQNLKEKIEQKTKAQEEEIKINTEKSIASGFKKGQEQIVNEMYNNCVELAKKEVENLLDEETHKHLIQKSIEQIENLNGIKL